MISGYNKNSPGTQTITVTYNGKTASFNVTVNPLIMTPAVSSPIRINRTNSTLSNIAPNTNISTFLSMLSANGGTFRLLDASGQPKTSGNIGTGTKVQLLNSLGDVVDEQTAMIYGDLSGDGNINLIDLVTIRDVLSKSKTIDSTSKLAGDLYGEGNITLNDLVGVMSDISDVGTINQNR